MTIFVMAIRQGELTTSTTDDLCRVCFVTDFSHEIAPIGDDVVSSVFARNRGVCHPGNVTRYLDLYLYRII